MRHFATRFRYSRWDGSQALEIAADDVLAAIADDLTEYGDLRWALRNLLSRGMQTGDHRVQGLRDIMRTLRDRRRERLEQFDLSSVMRDIEQQLARIVEMEQDTIDEWMDRDEDEYADRVLQDIAERNQEAIDDLPEDVGGKMKTLEGYEFLNPDAQRKFLELLNQLRKAMTQTFFNDIERMVNQMSGEDINRMKDMIKALNEMLTRKIANNDPASMISCASSETCSATIPRSRWTNCSIRCAGRWRRRSPCSPRCRRNSASSCSRCYRIALAIRNSRRNSSNSPKKWTS